MAVVVVFEEEVIRVICAYALLVGKSDNKKEQLYCKVACGRDLQKPGEMILSLVHFNGHVGRRLMVFRVCNVDVELEKEKLRQEHCLEFCNKRVVCGKHLVLKGPEENNTKYGWK